MWLKGGRRAGGRGSESSIRDSTYLYDAGDELTLTGHLLCIDQGVVDGGVQVPPVDSLISTPPKL
jgi:hypothetical protein